MIQGPISIYMPIQIPVSFNGISTNLSTNVNLRLDEVCEVCRTSGVLGEKHECPNCKGRGYVMTQYGKTLMEFMSRHLADLNRM